MQYACYADRLHEIHINYDGKLYKCTGKDYTPELEFGYLDEKGTAKLNYSKEAKHFCKLTVEDKLCQDCKYLPMCGGACMQNYQSFIKHICLHEKFGIPIETGIIKNHEFKKKYQEINEKRNSGI
jgi:uncharacterized protein